MMASPCSGCARALVRLADVHGVVVDGRRRARRGLQRAGDQGQVEEAAGEGPLGEGSVERGAVRHGAARPPSSTSIASVVELVRHDRVEPQEAAGPRSRATCAEVSR